MDSQCKHPDVEPHAAPPAHPMCGLDSKHKSSGGTNHPGQQSVQLTFA